MPPPTSVGSWRITRRPKFSRVGNTSDSATGLPSAYSVRPVAAGGPPSTGLDTDSRAASGCASLKVVSTRTSAAAAAAVASSA